MNRTHHLLVCADDTNILSGNVNTIKKNMKGPLDANEEDDKEENADDTTQQIYI